METIIQGRIKEKQKLMIKNKIIKIELSIPRSKNNLNAEKKRKSGILEYQNMLHN